VRWDGIGWDRMDGNGIGWEMILAISGEGRGAASPSPSPSPSPPICMEERCYSTHPRFLSSSTPSIGIQAILHYYWLINNYSTYYWLCHPRTLALTLARLKIQTPNQKEKGIPMAAARTGPVPTTPHDGNGTQATVSRLFGVIAFQSAVFLTVYYDGSFE